MFSEIEAKHSYVKLMIFPAIIAVVVLGVFLKKGFGHGSTVTSIKEEGIVANASSTSLVAEISGGVKNPGVYKFTDDTVRGSELSRRADGLLGDTDI